MPIVDASDYLHIATPWAELPRVRYTFSLLFEHLVPIPYRLSGQLRSEPYAAYPQLWYGTTPPAVKGVPWIPASPLLREEGVRAGFRPGTGSCWGLPVLFPHNQKKTLLPFDLPAMTFYLASRYEEYQPFEGDTLGRFPAHQSIAYREGFLHHPLLNIWIHWLARLLQKRYPLFSYAISAAEFHPTYDVDLAWAYRHRPAWRTVAAALRHLLQGEISVLQQQMKVLTGRQPDPFFTFDYLERQHRKHGLHPRFFFLLGDYAPYDKNIAADHPALQALIQHQAAHSSIGIHPSFQSNEQPGQLEREIGRLARISGQNVRHSRQHFLMLHFPSTYRRLINAGITDDYSMGYADQVGFRASIATPYPWYDLSQEVATPLTVHPFAAMDVTLQQYLRLPPDEALALLRGMQEEVQAVGGHFTLLWHNSSFSELHGWRGWQRVFEKTLSFASRKKDKDDTRS